MSSIKTLNIASSELPPATSNCSATSNGSSSRTAITSSNSRSSDIRKQANNNTKHATWKERGLAPTRNHVYVHDIVTNMFNITSNMIMFVNSLTKHSVKSCSAIQISIDDFLQFVMFIFVFCFFWGGDTMRGC